MLLSAINAAEIEYLIGRSSWTDLIPADSLATEHLAQLISLTSPAIFALADWLILVTASRFNVIKLLAADISRISWFQRQHSGKSAHDHRASIRIAISTQRNLFWQRLSACELNPAELTDPIPIFLPDLAGKVKRLKLNQGPDQNKSDISTNISGRKLIRQAVRERRINLCSCCATKDLETIIAEHIGAVV